MCEVQTTWNSSHRNLAEKVDECPLNRDRFVCIQLGPRKLSVIWSSGVSAFQGLLSIEVNGRTVGTSGIVRYIIDSIAILSMVISWVSAFEGVH